MRPMDPLPTPYDITDIPIFPYEPGLFEWLLLLSLAIIVLSAAALNAKRKARSKVRSAAELADEELAILAEKSRSAPLSKDDMASAVLITKRFIAMHDPTDLTSHTSGELLALAEERNSPQLKNIAGILGAIDQQLFRPVPDAAPAASTIEALRTALRDYLRTFEKKEAAWKPSRLMRWLTAA